MKSHLILAALAVSMLAGTDALAQGQNTGKRRVENTGRFGQPQLQQRQQSPQWPVYDSRDGYGKNHGSYQGRGKKKGHFKKKHHGDRSTVYGERPVIYRDRDVRQAPQPNGGVWDILGGRR